MTYTSNLIEKLLIFICCLMIYLLQDDMAIGVVMILISIIISGFLSYFDDDRIKTVLTVGFFVLSCFYPALIVFMPLIAYDMFFHKYQYLNLFGIIPLFYFSRSASIQTASIYLIITILCILARYHTEEENKLHAKYNELSDKTREMSLQLEKQNNDLIKNQDNELYVATLNERNRIAREIHDNVGHLLSSAILQSGALLTIIRDDKIREHIKTLNDTLSQAMNSIRNSVHELYDESIDLNARIEDIINQFTFCEISYEYDFSSNPGKKLKYAFISIVKEALSNIMRHSDATRASVAFREHPALYQMIIRDNGTVKSYSMDNGLGLKNMIDRVHAFNGNFNVITENGFEIFVSIPKEGFQT
ncbi:MAG: histidine kinase [Clostridiaceae bacterium]